MVGVGLLLDPAAVPATAYWAFVLLDGALLATASLFRLHALHLVEAPKTHIMVQINLLLPALLLTLIGMLSLTSNDARAIQPQSRTWWELVVGAFVAGFGCWYRRSRIEETIEDLADSASVA
jgi:hypothetical protein